MRVAAIAILSACDAAHPAPAVDAPPPPITYSLSVGSDHARPDLALTIWIDGSATAELDEVYDATVAGTVVQHTIELRYQDIAVATRVAADQLVPCSGEDGPLTSYVTGWGALDSGDLRPGGAAISTTSGVCNAEGFGAPQCQCAAGTHCVPRVSYEGPPRFTHLACAPIGPKQHGDACTFTPDPAGAYDDCGDTMFCYQGTCHTLCVNPPGTVGATPPSPEYAPDVALCD